VVSPTSPLFCPACPPSERDLLLPMLMSSFGFDYSFFLIPAPPFVLINRRLTLPSLYSDGIVMGPLVVPSDGYSVVSRSFHSSGSPLFKTLFAVLFGSVFFPLLPFLFTPKAPYHIFIPISPFPARVFRCPFSEPFTIVLFAVCFFCLLSPRFCDDPSLSAVFCKFFFLGLFRTFFPFSSWLPLPRFSCSLPQDLSHHNRSLLIFFGLIPPSFHWAVPFASFSCRPTVLPDFMSLVFLPSETLR